MDHTIDISVNLGPDNNMPSSIPTQPATVPLDSVLEAELVSPPVYFVAATDCNLLQAPTPGLVPAPSHDLNRAPAQQTVCSILMFLNMR